MRKLGFGLLILVVFGFTTMLHASAVDTIDFNTGQTGTYFIDDTSYVGSSPYYRGQNQDWGWTHNAITTESPIASASLWISAWDVDEGYSNFIGEFDEIFVKNEGVNTSLGFLTQGNTNTWGYTEFILDSSLFDEIETGLEVFMDIDTLNEGWLVTLAKSVLTVNGGTPPNPNPGAPVPEPATMLLFGLGLLGLAGANRKK